MADEAVNTPALGVRESSCPNLHLEQNLGYRIRTSVIRRRGMGDGVRELVFEFPAGLEVPTTA